MESAVFDSVKFEKEKAVARFNRLRRVVRLGQIAEIAVFFVLISWCSARAPPLLKFASAFLIDLSNHLFNHHVVFLIGNAIIVLLLTLCRQSDATFSCDFSEAAAAINRRDCAPPDPDGVQAAESGDCEKQIAVRAEERKPIAQCDDVAAAIEKAKIQIQRFQRTQSEILKREIAVRRPELRRSETENCRKAEYSEAADIETLSSEEFRRRVDSFIDKHWGKRTRKQNQLKQFGNFQLQCSKVASVQ